MALLGKILFLCCFFIPTSAELLDDKDDSSKSIQDFNKPWIHSPKNEPKSDKLRNKNRIEPSEDKSSFHKPNYQPVAIGIILGMSENQKKPMGIVISFHNGEILGHQFGKMTNFKQFQTHDQMEDEKSKEKHLNAEQNKFLTSANKKAKPKQNQPKIINTNLENDEDDTFLSDMEGYNWLD
uniref:Uncharacterized protein n=1 Tax=Strigamia maritima TaxID=126957 RepID=T1JHG0_STRMM